MNYKYKLETVIRQFIWIFFYLFFLRKVRGSNPRADCSTYQFSKLTPSPTWVTFLLSEWWELNPWPVVYKTTALTNWATFQCCGDGRNWTSDFLDMNQVFSHWTTSPWWFHRDSNPNVFSSVAKCFIQLNYETIVVPTGLEPILFWTKTRRVANYTTGQF